MEETSERERTETKHTMIYGGGVFHRLQWIDVAKGIAIIWVVIGHSFRDEMFIAEPNLYLVKKVIYTFHMPLFLMLSGYTYGLSLRKAQTVADFAKKKAKSLLIPFVSYCVLLYVIFGVAFLLPLIKSILLEAGFDSVGVLPYIQRTLLDRNPYSYHVWFLWVLFLMQIACFGIEKIVGQKRGLTCTMLIAILASVVESNAGIEYHMLSMLMQDMIYFVAGEFICNYSRGVVENKKWILGSTSIFILLILYQCCDFDIYSLRGVNLVLYNIGEMLFKLCVITSLISILKVAMLLENVSILKRIGRKSYGIYLFHQPFFSAFMGVILYSKLHLSSTLSCTICSIISILAPVLIVECANRNRITKMAFKKLFNVG